jgi:molecular chaperone GrpE
MAPRSPEEVMEESEDRLPEEEDTYQLDLDSDDDPEEAAREALAAVEQRQREHHGEEEAADFEDEDDPVARLEVELADLRDRSLRTLADFENYRKRTERERRDLKLYASSEVMRELLPVVDNLHRALDAGGSLEDLRTGVEMIVRQVREVLRQHGVEPVAAEGEAFDPTLHEAVTREESSEVDHPTVVQELQTGYRMHDRLLRPALVRVAVPEEDATEDGAAGQADDEQTED